MRQEEKQYCFGCGAELQYEHPLESGYVPKEVYLSKKASLCKRCFRLQHYGEEEIIFPASSDFIPLIERAKKKKALLIYVLDFFAYDFSLFENFGEELQGLDIFLVGNKRDILPKSMQDSDLIRKIQKEAKKYGLTIVDTLLTSASRNYNIDDFKEKMEVLRKGRDVYVMGAVSAGKSSLINTLLKNYQNRTDLCITTSPYPGTTLDVIRVPLDYHSFIFDTPGYPIPGSLIEMVERKNLKLIIPQNEMKPQIYQINEKQALLLGGLARIEFLEGPKSSFVIYASSSMLVQRSKLERAEDAFFSLISHKGTRPIDAHFMKREDFVKEEHTLSQGKYEINIVGYAWVLVNFEKESKLRIALPRGARVKIEKVD